MVTTTEPIMPSAQQARDGVFVHLREALLGIPERSARLVGPDGRETALPDGLYQVLVQAVEALASGRGVAVVAMDQELTTQQAADILNVSRPYFVGLLEQGSIPFRLVGTHRRVHIGDLLDYRQKESARRKGIIAQMAREAEDLGEYEVDGIHRDA